LKVEMTDRIYIQSIKGTVNKPKRCVDKDHM